jgi:hypothetical protein
MSILTLAAGILAVAVYSLLAARLIAWWEDRRQLDRLSALRLRHSVHGDTAGVTVTWLDPPTGAQVSVVVPWELRGQDRALLLARESRRLVEGAVESAAINQARRRHPSGRP